MKKLFFGAILGIAALFLFLYFGGGRYLKMFGAKTEDAGSRLESYGKELKKTTEGARVGIIEKFEETKDKLEETKDKLKEAEQRAKEVAP
ncbi:MAG: hypothetical protein AABZ23_01740 [Deltaproteobacteria bacterium]